MKINTNISWNFAMRMAEINSIKIFMPILLYVKWFKYQYSRLTTIYFKHFLQCPHRKNYFRVFFELIYLLFKWRCIPFHYFRHFLYMKKYPFLEITTYLPETVFYYRLLPSWRIDSCLVDDRIIFYHQAKGLNIPVPKTILILRDRFIFDGELNVISNEEHWHETISTLSLKCVFLKPSLCSSGGNDIVVFHQDHTDYTTTNGKKLTFKLAQSLARSGSWILQEGIEQSRQTRQFFPKATNTFKVTTSICNSKVTVLCCILRFGQKEMEIDNVHNGGLFVGVNPDTGEFDSVAFDVNLTEYKKHPDTGLKFSGMAIDISSVIKIAKTAAAGFSSLKILGWDIVLTDIGPVILEGNSSPDIGTVQRFGGVAPHLFDN